jgi:hypothetical protein
LAWRKTCDASDDPNGLRIETTYLNEFDSIIEGLIGHSYQAVGIVASYGALISVVGMHPKENS